MLEGLLVDLVPYGTRFAEQEPVWRNNESWFWATVGERHILAKTQLDRRRQERAEWAEQHGSQNVAFGIQTKDGKPLGDMSLNWVLGHQRLSMLGASIGDSDFWGGGYGTDALLLAVDYAFDWLDLRKLWLATMSPNMRVVRQMEKVGFMLEVRQREATWVDGKPGDILLYGLLREEWPGRDAVIERIGLRVR
jgi:RimJ/RimL family protein N-acetyltransferase